MSWRDIRILYLRELRSALRERAIVVNSILIPIFLYPLMLWLMFTGITYVEGQADRTVSRVAVVGLPERHAELRDSLAALGSIELLPPVAEGTSETPAAAAVRTGELDAVVEFLEPDSDAAMLADNFAVRITYDRSEDRSQRASTRVERAIDDYRGAWVDREASAREIGPTVLEQFRVERENAATGDEMGALLLGEMIPVFLIIMVALGCFYPAIDSTAGERERSTWETLMTVGASRASIVSAKYLYVATLGILAGSLNVIAMTATMGAVIAPIVGGDATGLQFRLPLLAVPVMILGAAALALLFAAAMMILASFARTFKDGQSMVTPVYWLALLPLLLLSGSPDRRLSAELALVPVVNVVQMIKDAIVGSFSWLLIAESMLVVLVLVGLCLWIARQVLRFEDHLLGAYDGSFWTFARARLLRRGTAGVGGRT